MSGILRAAALNTSIDDAPPMYTYLLAPQLGYHASHVTTLALIQRGATLDPSFLNLFAGDETPYDGDSKLGIPMTKKKFGELEVPLLHLQQNAKIPETQLAIHSVIRRVVQKAQEAGVRPKISHLPPNLLNDSSFLNAPHNDVNS
jgi:Dynein heavy chain, N-terminal region 1